MKPELPLVTIADSRWVFLGSTTVTRELFSGHAIRRFALRFTFADATTSTLTFLAVNPGGEHWRLIAVRGGTGPGGP
jgi:hypothetical protein